MKILLVELHAYVIKEQQPSISRSTHFEATGASDSECLLECAKGCMGAAIAILSASQCERYRCEEANVLCLNEHFASLLYPSPEWARDAG
ncbi:hypothetical protein CEJ86_30560 [Sinorhizobium meliloti]|uniref:Uncharacterized protein n=1 Tax=Rhizobium meliloti TaxID=382 RepID=A0A2J0YTW4_RHIML|nr:hypothetical protein CEJ86_30560 [Sinorhizobium meliloti]